MADFDLATQREDHQAVGLELRWEVYFSFPPAGHAVPTVEWSSSEVQHFVRNQMKELQIMLWATDLETQEVHLSDQIQQFLRQKCARKP
jgi:hypothetical protein